MRRASSLRLVGSAVTALLTISCMARTSIDVSDGKGAGTGDDPYSAQLGEDGGVSAEGGSSTTDARAQNPDASHPDANTPDASTSPDADEPDADVEQDAAPPEDAGEVDATIPDAGPPDTGAQLDAGSDAKADAAKDAAPDAPHDSGSDAAVDASVPPSSDSCAAATPIVLSNALHKIDVPLDTTGAAHSIDAPCTTGTGGARFFEITFSKAIILYADTFGSSVDTTVFLLSSQCAPLSTTTMDGDVLCSDDACATKQSQVVALLNPGKYKIGVAGRGGEFGKATLHLQWAFAASGAEKSLPKGTTTQSGTTMGASGNLQGLSSTCLAAGPEDNYWWTTCPSDPGGALTASTCGGASWETTLSIQIPGTTAYKCSIDACGFQSQLSYSVPAGAGLRVLSVDGETATDYGNYSMSVTRP